MNGERDLGWSLIRPCAELWDPFPDPHRDGLRHRLDEWDEPSEVPQA